MIVELEEAKRELVGMRPDIEELSQALHIQALTAKVEELEQTTLAPDFWGDQARSSRVLQTIKQSKDTIEEYTDLKSRLEDAIALAEMAIEENDEDSLPEVKSELADLKAQAERMRIEALMVGEYDNSTAIVSFHPGAGGTEAQDWCQMLYRMITRWAETNKFKVKLLDWLDGDAAGLKSATITVEGPHAYGFLKSENGVHRLVRVSRRGGARPPSHPSRSCRNSPIWTRSSSGTRTMNSCRFTPAARADRTSTRCPPPCASRTRQPASS